MNGEAGSRGRHGSWKGVALWGVALLLMMAAAIYQRRTGPSYPVHGEYSIAGRTQEYALIRTHDSDADARITLSDPGPGVSGTLHYRRYPTGEEFRATAMRAVDGRLVGELPAQPAAGKIEYYITLGTAADTLRIPEPERGNVVLRYKDPVPIHFLLPHVLMMFLAMLVGMRAGLAALFAPAPMRRLAWLTLAGMTLGGMVLGPIVQKYAFGAFWTGFPFGYDLTDNKVLIMWLVWAAACAIIRYRPGRRDRAARLAVAVAAMVMLSVYVIPHSAQGSELDYEALEKGVPASDAVRTGPRR